MNFEKQLQLMADKKSLHEWVDSLDDNVELSGVILLREDGHKIGDKTSDECKYTFHHIGNVTVAESLYLTKSFEHWLFAWPVSDNE